MTDLRRAWDAEADRWVRFARTPGHDRSFWDFGLPVFRTLLPPPSGLCIDLGCGEGRLRGSFAQRATRWWGSTGLRHS